jgi:hypothetical protein
MLFVIRRWGKSRTAWRSICPVWPPIFSVAVSSKFTGLFVRSLFFAAFVPNLNTGTVPTVLYIGNRDQWKQDEFEAAQYDDRVRLESICFQFTFPLNVWMCTGMLKAGDDYPVKNPWALYCTWNKTEKNPPNLLTLVSCNEAPRWVLP